ncbi:helix-turn-helix domain-containing protein [Pontibacter locisalis]|uniref:Helix-turn-helix domain-containing protein n=1 Tax=Pontibacter locisalis TaxID=1719035 RepID=A0ABW5IKN3_9BACT
MENQFLFQMKAEEAIEAIARRVVELLSVSRQEQKPTLENGKEDPINTDEACALLRITSVTLLNWRKRGMIPYHRKGGRIYFYRSEILESLEKPWGRPGRRRGC